MMQFVLERFYQHLIILSVFTLYDE